MVNNNLSYLHQPPKKPTAGHYELLLSYPIFRSAALYPQHPQRLQRVQHFFIHFSTNHLIKALKLEPDPLLALGP